MLVCLPLAAPMGLSARGGLRTCARLRAYVVVWGACVPVCLCAYMCTRVRACVCVSVFNRRPQKGGWSPMVALLV